MQTQFCNTHLYEPWNHLCLHCPSPQCPSPNISAWFWHAQVIHHPVPQVAYIWEDINRAETAESVLTGVSVWNRHRPRRPALCAWTSLEACRRYTLQLSGVQQWALPSTQGTSVELDWWFQAPHCKAGTVVTGTCPIYAAGLDSGTFLQSFATLHQSASLGGRAQIHSCSCHSSQSSSSDDINSMSFTTLLINSMSFTTLLSVQIAEW